MPKVTKKKPRKTAARTASATTDRAARATLVRRLWRAADAQVKELEIRIATTLEPAERERDARTMAVLVKTLRDIGELDGARGKRAAQSEDSAGAGATADVNYDDPREIDDFRRELARRIEAIKSAADPEAAGEL